MTTTSSDADASFFWDALHHLTYPLIVNARSLASQHNTTPDAIEERVNRMKEEYNIEITCEGTRSPNKTSAKGPDTPVMGEVSPESRDKPLGDVLRKPIAAPPAAIGGAPCTATDNARGISMKRQREEKAAVPRQSKKTNHSTASTIKVEQTFGNDAILFDGGDSDYVDE